MKYLSIATLILSLFMMSSCEELEESEATASTTKEIYYRIQYDTSYPSQNGASSCDITPGNYLDNNDFVPYNANFNQYYGPCESGPYSAQYVWDISSNSNHILYFDYTLSAPAVGYRRYYTQVLIDYFESTNRCHNVTLDPSYLTYVDVKI